MEDRHGPSLLSDLRERVNTSIEARASCGQAAERFGIVIATAIRWQARHAGRGQA